MRKRAVVLLALIPLAMPIAAFALANLVVSRTEVTFPERCVRTSAKRVPVTVSNEGNRDATDVTVVISPAAMRSLFPLAGATAVPTLGEGEDLGFSVGFVPAIAGQQSATARIDYTSQANASGSTTPSPQSKSTGIPVSGSGIDRFIDASPRVLGWGEVRIGTQSSIKAVTVFDDGDSPLTIERIAIRGSHASDFSVGPTGSTTISDGSPLTLRVRFTPRGTGARTARLEVTSNACENPTAVVELSGIGTAPDIIALPGRVEFEPIAPAEIAEATVSIANQGGADLTVTSLTLRGRDEDLFGVSERPRLPRTLAPGEAFDVKVKFEPAEAGTGRARIAVRSNDFGADPLVVELVGRAVLAPTPTPTATPTPTVLPTIEPTAPAEPAGSLVEYVPELAIIAGVTGFFAALAAVRRARGLTD